MAHRRHRTVNKPLSQRNGIDPVRLKLPAEFPTELLAHCENPAEPTVGEYLTARFYPHVPRVIAQRFAEQEIVDGAGTPLTESTPFVPGLSIWYFRELEPEPSVPTDLPVLFEDEWLIAVDKPHYLPTTPRGMYVAHTALTMLRVTTQNPELSPAHRLDRPTAGVLLFAKTPAARGPLQMLFQQRETQKTYEAIAPVAPSMEEGDARVVRSHIVKERGVLQVLQDPPSLEVSPTQVANAISRITLTQKFRVDPGFQKPSRPTNPELIFPAPGEELGLYRLTPLTGKTHQLRAHMQLLSTPILGDVMYPRLINTYPDDPALPLQLLAKTLQFTHPFTGENLTIHSLRHLTYSPFAPHKPAIESH